MMLWSVSKYKHWDRRLALEQSAKQTLLSKPRFPFAKAGRIWSGVYVTVYAISPSRKLKCTCPTLTQQNRVTGMWSGEEGSCTSSGHWFPLRGLPLPRQTPYELAAPRGAAEPLPRAAQQMGRLPDTTAPRMHQWVWDQQPRHQRHSLWAQGCWHTWIVLLPSFQVIPSLPKTVVPLPFPCSPLPPSPRHEWHFLVLPRGPHLPATSCYVWVQTLALLMCNEFMLLSSWTWAPNSAGGDSCRLSFFFSVACQGTTLRVWLTTSQAGPEGVNFLVTLLWGFLLWYCKESSCSDAKEKAGQGGSPSSCNTWSCSACVNKYYTLLSVELKTIRTTSLQPELNKHSARLREGQGTAHQSVSEIQNSSAAFSSSAFSAAAKECTDQPTLWD